MEKFFYDLQKKQNALLTSTSKKLSNFKIKLIFGFHYALIIGYNKF
jgi:hypothetical protein